MSASFGKAGPKPSQPQPGGFAGVRDSLRGKSGSQGIRSFGTQEAKVAEAKPSGLPRSWIAALWLLAIGAAGFGAMVVPAFYTCYTMQQRGEFFYGAAVHSCTGNLAKRTIGGFQDKLERMVRGY